MRVSVAAAAALLIGIVALAVPPATPDQPISWQSLLAPYSDGALLAGNFRIAEIRRGAGDVVVLVTRTDDTATVEVHVVQRGRWTNVRESQSFGIGFELPRSPAAERNAVTEALAEAVRSKDHGLPSPDAIPLQPSSDSSVLSWWLEMLRGGRGLLIGLSIALLALIGLLPSNGLAILGVVLGIADIVARGVGIPSMQGNIGAAWIVPGSVVLLFLASRHRGLGSPDDRLLALAIAVLALALRLGLGSWGPLHVNGYAPRFVVAAARDPTALEPYGPGYVEIFGPIAALAPSNPDWAIFACNALFSALAAAAAFVLARAAGVTARAALAAGLLLAIDPVAIHMAATESYFPVIILLCTLGAAVVLLAVQEIEAGFRWRAAAYMGAAALLLAAVIRSHPTAWTLAATVPFAACAAQASVRNRMVVLVVGAVLTCGVAIVTSAGTLLDVVANIRAQVLMQPLPPPSLWPLAWIAAGAVIYGVIAPSARFAIPAALTLAALLMTRHAYSQSWVWQQSYDRLYLTVPVIAAVGAIPASLLRRTWFVAGASVLLGIAWFRFGLPIVESRTTEHLEYQWLRRQFVELPPDCRVIYLSAAAKRVMVLPTYVGSPSRTAIGMNPAEPHTIEAALAPAPCVYYVHTSLCSSADGRPACDAIERRLSLIPLVRTSFPAIVTSPYAPYDSDAVETAIARVERIGS